MGCSKVLQDGRSSDNLEDKKNISKAKKLAIGSEKRVITNREENHTGEIGRNRRVTGSKRMI